MVIQILPGQVKLELTKLKGSMSFNQLVDFGKPLLEKVLSLEVMDDPCQCRNDLANLSRIHEHINKVTESPNLKPDEKYKARY